MSYKPPAIWVDAALMRALCPSCAERMDELRISKVRLDAMPEAMLSGLCEKFGGASGFRDRCMSSSIPVDDLGAFCNWLKIQCHGSSSAEDAKSSPRRSDSQTRRGVVRTDVSRLDKFERTPSGGLRIPAALTRVGVLDYVENGKLVRELRPIEEVLAEDSIASLEDAPVCDLHPPEMVSPANWQQYAKGQTRGAHADGTNIAADLAIQDGALIAKIERGDRKEISAGYTCDLEMTSGVYNGEPYDAVQRNIRYNHVAVGPNGWGRAGPEVALRLDHAAGAEAMKVTVDGKEYERGSAEHIAALDALCALRTRERDEARGRVDSLTIEVAAQKKRADDLGAGDVVFGQKMAARFSLVDAARKVMGDAYNGMKDDGSLKSDREVMTDALKKMGRDVSDDAKAYSDDYVRGAFDAAMSGFAAMQGQGVGPLKSSESMHSANAGEQTATDSKRSGITVVKTPANEVPTIDKSEPMAKIAKDNADYHTEEARTSRFAMSK